MQWEFIPSDPCTVAAAQILAVAWSTTLWFSFAVALPHSVMHSMTLSLEGRWMGVISSASRPLPNIQLEFSEVSWREP